MTLSINSQIESNKTKTYVVMAFFTLLITTIVFIFSRTSGYGWSYAGYALIISGIIGLTGYYWSDKIVLRMSRAHEADRQKEINLYSVIDHIVSISKLPKPRVYIIEDRAPNAFATGRDPQHAVVCVTRGLMEKLDKRELEGVIAHEISHIQNYDIRLMAIVTVLVGMMAFLSDQLLRMFIWGGRGRDNEGREGSGAILALIGIILAFLSPIIATIIQLAISRKREYLADASGVLLTRNPEGLASALTKISKDFSVLKSASNATAHLYIVNPFAGKDFGTWFTGLFNTHPPIEERITILRSM